METWPEAWGGLRSTIISKPMTAKSQIYWLIQVRDVLQYSWGYKLYHGVSNPVFQTHSKDQGALTIMGFPPQSPDLNPIEYLWGLGLRTEKAKHYVTSQDAL